MLSSGELTNTEIGVVQRFHCTCSLSLHCRGNKTKNNRKFRKHVLGCTTTDTSTVPSEVTWLDCQEAIISLQLQAGCTVRLCKGPEELAQYVFSLTKAMSEKPFRLVLTVLVIKYWEFESCCYISLTERKVPSLSTQMQLVETRKRYCRFPYFLTHIYSYSSIDRWTQVTS